MSPIKPLHPCNSPGCPQLAHTRYCPEHTKQVEQKYERERGTATERGYNATWAKVRIIKLNSDPLCERCLVNGHDVAAILVHHKDHNPKNNLWYNLESMCSLCHDAEHKAERWR
jgi:5-methylcytosine-specific restriction protein A